MTPRVIEAVQVRVRPGARPTHPVDNRILPNVSVYVVVIGAAISGKIARLPGAGEFCIDLGEKP